MELQLQKTKIKINQDQIVAFWVVELYGLLDRNLLMPACG
jgi:hypothetical protein